VRTPGDPIIIVDDTLTDVTLVASRSRGRGTNVQRAADAGAALTALRTFRPPRIVMDGSGQAWTVST
jgi:CheY-like chemotaxis protein